MAVRAGKHWGWCVMLQCAQCLVIVDKCEFVHNEPRGALHKKVPGYVMTEVIMGGG